MIKEQQTQSTQEIVTENALITSSTLKDAELLLRFIMILILLTAAISKLLGQGSFQSYYLNLFSNPELRFTLPNFFIRFFLEITPYLELILGLAFFITKIRRVLILVWTLFFGSLIVGHYILMEWNYVMLIVPIIILSTLDFILPSYNHPLQRK